MAPKNPVAAVQTGVAQNGAAPPVADDPKQDVSITPGLQRVEEKVEYRDENGNILNEEQVKALEGKVSFSTKYETRTRLVDDYGNEIGDLGPGEELVEDSYAGTLAEAENPETGYEADVSAAPPKVNANADLKKEAAIEVEAAKENKAEPEGDASAATGKDEL